MFNGDATNIENQPTFKAQWALTAHFSQGHKVIGIGLEIVRRVLGGWCRYAIRRSINVRIAKSL